mgnify:CR=1 FL=1
MSEREEIMQSSEPTTVNVENSSVPSVTTAKNSAKRKKKIKAKTKSTVAKRGSNFQKPRSFPRESLNGALQVALKIKELNGGNPWSADDVAKALDMGAKANNFYYVTAAARDFGLTVGTRGSARIELAPLGREIVYAPNAQVEHEKKVEAFLRIDSFKKVLNHYNGSSLPEMKYLGNTLEKEFDIPPEFHNEFSNLFRRNCEELGINAGAVISERDEKSNLSANFAPATVTLGEIRGKQKSSLKAFVIMPFVERDESHPVGFFAEVLRSLITPAALDAGFSVETANKHGSDVIQSTIINDLLEADLVIADLTSHNPNVLFELGVRMAKDKPVALIKSTKTGKIFDVDNMLRVFEYDHNLWSSTIERDLPKIAEHIKAAWENRDKNLSYMKILTRGVEQMHN